LLIHKSIDLREKKKHKINLSTFFFLTLNQPTNAERGVEEGGMGPWVRRGDLEG